MSVNLKNDKGSASGSSANGAANTTGPPTATSNPSPSPVGNPNTSSFAQAYALFPNAGTLPTVKPAVPNGSDLSPASPATKSVVPSVPDLTSTSSKDTTIGKHSLFPPVAVSTTNAPAPVKRKRGPVKGSKRVKKTIIDDEVACEIFRELRLSNQFLNCGKVLCWALQPDDETFINIHDYVARGQEHGFGIKILAILRVIVKADALYAGESPLEHQLDFNEDPDATGKLRMMLWHGTRRSALVSILENGLRIPGLRGQMFGAGIYLSDRVSKSSQYCDHGYTYNGSVAYLFLCDVLLGDMFQSYHALPNTTAPPATLGRQYDSIKGCGRRVPDPALQKSVDGCVWPLGPTINTPNFNGTLQFNEYIVYNSKQIQPKYLVKVQFTRNPVYEKLY